MTGLVSEARIEESCIMYAKFTNQRIERQHLCGELRWDRDCLARSENIELVGVQHDGARAAGVDRVPKLHGVKRAPFIDVDDSGMTLGPPSHLLQCGIAF